MAMVVQHNLTAMNANRMLGITAGQQAKSTEKLSSGYKINRAADDAAGLSISEKMRKQIRGLSQASDNAEDGISAVQTAEGALTEVHDMLQRMNELAVQASNETNSESDRKSIQDEIDQLVDEIDRVSETTKFNETYLLKGDKAGEKATDFKYKSANVTSTTLYMLGDDGKFTEIKAGSYFDTLDTSATYFTSPSPKKVGEAYTTVTDFTSTETVINATNYYVKGTDGNFTLVKEGAKYDSGQTYYTVSFTTDGTVGTATAVTAATATGYVASTDIYDTNGTLIKSGSSLGTTVNVSDYFKSVGEGMYDTTDKVADISTYSTSSDKVQFTDANGNEIAANGLSSYLDNDGKLKSGAELYLGDKLVTQADVDNLVDSSNKYDTGILSLKLHVGADATENNAITLDIESMSAKSLGVSGLSVSGKDNENALNAIETISAAISKVSAQRSTLGAVQNRLEHTINNLDNVVENTTSAESQIRDTDMAAEMVEYSKNNILAQAGQSMLAQANQSTQGILSILG